MSADSVIERDPDKLGGTAVFAGTCVPIQNLRDYLSAGDTIDEFLDSFPTVAAEQVQALLRSDEFLKDTK